MSDKLKINQFIDLLKEYNETTNIYSKSSYDVLDYHVKDSQNLASLLYEDGVHVDLGSGSGLPAIILAILTKSKIICVESKQKKRTFLNVVKDALDLNNLKVFDGDVQLFTKSYSGAKITSFSAKAFAKPPKLLMYLSMFRPHQFDKSAICWVPISERQKSILKDFDEVLKIENLATYYYFKIRMNSFQSYKADLKTKYNL